MNPRDIVLEYRQGKNKRQMITALADQHQCTQADIRELLELYGETPPAAIPPTREKAPIPPKARAVLERYQNNTKAAHILGVSRDRIYYLRKRLREEKGADTCTSA